jgi:hypothetical protein
MVCSVDGLGLASCRLQDPSLGTTIGGPLDRQHGQKNDEIHASVKGGETRQEAERPRDRYPWRLYFQRIDMALAKKKRVGKRTIAANQVRKTASGRKARKSDGKHPAKGYTPPRAPAAA